MLETQCLLIVAGMALVSYALSKLIRKWKGGE